MIFFPFGQLQTAIVWNKSNALDLIVISYQPKERNGVIYISLSWEGKARRKSRFSIWKWAFFFSRKLKKGSYTDGFSPSGAWQSLNRENCSASQEYHVLSKTARDVIIPLLFPSVGRLDISYLKEREKEEKNNCKLAWVDVWKQCIMEKLSCCVMR